MRERWRVTTEHEGYEVSSEGRVRNRSTGRVLQPCRTSRGYMKVSLGRQRQRYVHRLVALAFHGPRPSPSDQVDHIDFDRTNNAASNLRWLPLLINCVRWQDRIDGRNVWSTPDSPPPEEHEAMSEQEQEQVARELHEAGWVA